MVIGERLLISGLSMVCGLRLPMQRVGNLEDQRAIGFSGKDTVGEIGLVINDKEIVDGAEDVVEAYLKGCQLTFAVVLEKSRGEEITGKGDISTQPEKMGVEGSLNQIDVVECITGAEVHGLVGSKLS
jgi:hypothetical protein